MFATKLNSNLGAIMSNFYFAFQTSFFNNRTNLRIKSQFLFVAFTTLSIIQENKHVLENLFSLASTNRLHIFLMDQAGSEMGIEDFLIKPLITRKKL